MLLVNGIIGNFNFIFDKREMKKYLVLMCLCLGLGLSLCAKETYKVNVKKEIKPYTIKIDKFQLDGDIAYLYGTVKQYERFSYSISFEDCAVSSNNGQSIRGKLYEWNGNKNIENTTKTISDVNAEKFILEFPKEAFSEGSGPYVLKLGNKLDREKTELILKDLQIKK